MPWGLNKNGFSRPNQAQLKEELDQRQREMYGEDINLSYKSPNGIFSGLLSWTLSKVWELGEKVYKGSHITEAEGTQLDYLTPYFYTSRKVEQYAEVPLELYGKPFHTVEAGTRFETDKGIDFETKVDVTLNEEGHGTVEGVSTLPGVVGNVPAGTVTVQSEPSAYVYTVINRQPAEGGRNRETDTELVERLKNSPSNNGAGTLDSIRSSVLNVLGVRSAFIKENNTMKVINGQSEKSFQVFAFGGDGQEVAEAIFDKQAAGIEAFGTSTYTVLDEAGNPHEVSFTPATAVGIHISVKLIVDSTFRDDGIEEIKQQLITMISGSSEGASSSGLDMGEDVVRFQIEQVIGRVQGVKDAIVELGKGPDTLTPNNIEIEQHEIAIIDPEDIDIQVITT